MRYIYFVLAATLIAGCRTSSRLSDNDLAFSRLNYNYRTKTLTKPGKTDEINSAVAVKAGNTVKIEVRDYNPLRTELIIEDSSSSFFLADTATFSRYIILPAVPNIKEGEAFKAANPGIAPMNNFFAVRAAGLSKCNQLKAAMVDINDLKAKLNEKMKTYREFAAGVERINSVYNTLKGLPSLTSADVQNYLSNNFIGYINTKIPAPYALNANPENTDVSEIMEVEQKLYSEISNLEPALTNIRKDFESVDQSQCSEYATLYKSFLSVFTEVDQTLNTLSLNHTEKILPAFDKSTKVYQDLKSYLTTNPLFVSRSIPINNDEYIVKLYAVEAGKAKTLVDQYSFFPVRGWKLDISGGIFVSGLSDHSFSRITMDSILAKKYVKDGQVRDTTVMQTFTKIKQQGQDNVSFGGMVYLNAHTQYKGYFNWGVTLGFGALFNDQARWAGSLGPSLILGKKQRLVISPSAIIGQVTRLSAEYEQDKWYSQTIDNVPTFKAWKVSWAVGISWNLR